jgi:hypothetical protein
MRIRTTAATAALALAGVFLTAPAGTAADTGLRLMFDAWAPSTGSCEQQVTFRVLPSSSDDAPAPTGTVRLVSEEGDELGQVPVQGFGDYEITGLCEDDGLPEHRVALAYDGDSEYAATSTSSPDTCPGQPFTPPAETWDFLVGDGEPQPVFWCHTNTGNSIRSADGRLYPRVGWSAMLPNPWEYGQRVTFSFDVSGDPRRQPTAPGGAVVASIDGRAQHTYVIDGGQGEHDWNVDTSGVRVGKHRLRIAYRGDPRWAPLVVESSTVTISRSRPKGGYSVQRWQLHPGQRPVVTFHFDNVWSRAAKAPTGRVSFYLGTRHLSDVRLRSSDHGRRTVTLPPVRRTGMQLLRVVYRGDSRYTPLDSTGPHWFASQQYLLVR